MQLQFLGSGDAFGAGGRFNTCFMVSASDTRFLIDCGATSLVAMASAGVDPNSIDKVLLTHLHGDHFAGVPFMLVHAHSASGRRSPLTIAGPRTTERRVMETMECLYPGSADRNWKFDIIFEEYDVGREWRSDSISVLPFQARHSAGEGPALALRITVDGKIITYSGDGGWSDDLLAAADGADLFIAECYFYDKQVDYHMSLTTLELHMAEINAKRVILTHMDDDVLERVQSLDLETAEDGKIIEI
ncbi:MAG: MBL fold metallo-hydrolase [Rhodospirillales bacterium]|nr:MBL fold metallo-hydrolase [Rhodospirillales bacterium]